MLNLSLSLSDHLTQTYLWPSSTYNLPSHLTWPSIFVIQSKFLLLIFIVEILISHFGFAFGEGT